MKRIQQGFTLIELMIVVAIVGILAAIAIPAYQDYMKRSKMSEVAGAIAACKTGVAEYHATKGSYPAAAADAGCSTAATQYMSALSVTTGVIAATAGTGVGAGAAGCVLTLTPASTTDGITAWAGTSPATCAKYVPASFR